MAKALPPCPSSRQARWVTDSWALEILACTMSIAATIAVGIVLLVYDGKPFPKLQYDIGLNTIVSILGTISKSALLLFVAASIGQYRWLNLNKTSRVENLLSMQLYDEASRGPWGSSFLLSSRLKWSWAKLGAVVTIFSLAFDPMYQLLIKFEQRQVYLSDPSANVKRAETFEDPSSQLQLIDFGESGLSSDWTLAISNAILSDSTNLEVNLACPAGNCSFPLFSTLGFCSNCANVTAYMQQHARCESENPTNAPPTMNCTYELPPAGPGLTYSGSGRDLDLVSEGSFNLSWMSGPGVGNLQDAPVFQTMFITPPLSKNVSLAQDYGPFQIPFLSDKNGLIPSTVSHIALIKLDPNEGSTSQGFIDSVNICALSFCGREYNVSVNSGVSNTSLALTYYSSLTVQEDPNRPYGQSSSYTFPNVTNNFTFNPGYTKSGPPVIMEGGLQRALSIILRGNILAYYSGGLLNLPATTPTDVLQVGLNASTDIFKTMDRVALAMTSHLRNLSNLSAYGQAAFTETYIRVEWPWFTLPALSVFIGMMFLAAAIIETRRQKLYIWKNSELGLFFHRLELASHNAPEITKVSEMEDIAGAMNVKLETGDLGGFLLDRDRRETETSEQRSRLVRSLNIFKRVRAGHSSLRHS